jgi:hypothetical protein
MEIEVIIAVMTQLRQRGLISESEFKQIELLIKNNQSVRWKEENKQK